MASRMDRYYSSNNVARSEKNKELYEKVKDDTLHNFNSIDTIRHSNEIDINKIKKIINNREQYKREQKLRETIEKSNIKFGIEPTDKILDKNIDIMDINVDKKEKNDEPQKPKNYDVIDILSKAKDDRGEVDLANRNLKNFKYNDLNSLNLHTKEYKNSEAELKDLINTINNKNIDNSDSDDVGLLDDLKSNTSVGNASSIKKVLEQEKEEQKKDDTKELDKTFFTNSMDFTDEDFDEVLAQRKNKKKKIIIVVIISLVVAITISVLYFTGILNFKINK